MVCLLFISFLYYSSSSYITSPQYCPHSPKVEEEEDDNAQIEIVDDEAPPITDIVAYIRHKRNRCKAAVDEVIPTLTRLEGLIEDASWGSHSEEVEERLFNLWLGYKQEGDRVRKRRRFVASNK